MVGVVACGGLWAVGLGHSSKKPIYSAANSGDFRIVDGDTIAIGRERIRLMGFDAAETYHPRCPKERALGERAKVRLAQLTRDAAIGLERHGRDRYGRTLAVLRVDGRDVAEIMIAEGLARTYHGERRKSWCGA